MMKRLFLVFLLLPLLLPATIYYVKNGGSDVATGLSDALAWNTITYVNTISFAAGDQILFKRGSVFTDAILTAKTGGDTGNPIIYGAYGTGNPPQISPAPRPFNTNGKSNLTCNGIDFVGRMLINASTAVILNYCIIRDAVATGDINGVHVTNSPGTLINNCIISGNANYGIDNSGATSTVTMRNCLIVSNNSYGVYNAVDAGALDVDYSFLGGNGFRPSKNYYATGLTLGAHNLIQTNPFLFSNKYPSASYVCFTVDDYDIDYVDSLAAAFSSYGAKLTFFVREDTFVGRDTVSRLQALHTAGHEIANHTYSHPDLAATQAFAITSTNTTPTCNVDIANTQIILSCTEGGNVVTVSWNSADKNITDLKTAVSGKGWTITTGTGINDTLKLASLADTTGAQAVPYTPLLDIVAPNYAFWREEITDTNTWLTSILGVAAPTHMAYVGGNRSTGLITWLKDVAGFTGGRIVGDLINKDLRSLPVYEISSMNPSYLAGDKSEAVIRAGARGIYIFTKNYPCIFTILVHTADELTVEQAGWLIDELYKCGVQVVTFGSALAAIRADHSTADNLTYTKAYTNISNFHLRPNSTLLRAGTNMSLTLDIVGNTVPAWTGKAPDIGAYENRLGGVFIF